jgi:hypothetical protein
VGFPKHIADQDAGADFLDSLVLNLYGVEAFIVQVDGQTTVLDDDYVTRTKSAPLLDGTPAGAHYIVPAVFLTPLSPNRRVDVTELVAWCKGCEADPTHVFMQMLHRLR